MEVRKEIVYICKSAPEECQNEEDPYKLELERRGFLVELISVLDFVYKNLDFLGIELNQPDKFSGIIFTSPRCVRAVTISVENSKNLGEKWKGSLVFAVGETTARLVQDNLDLNAEGSWAGNGKTLAPLIVKSNPSKPLLLPCGNLKMDTLEDLLKQSGLKVETVEVYETRPHPKLKETLTSALAEKEPAYIIYFSPSGIRFTYPILKQCGINFNKIKWVSIGPTTAEALESYGLQVHCSAAKPTPQCLGEALTAAQL